MPYLAIMDRFVACAVTSLACVSTSCQSKPSGQTLYVTTSAQPILPALNEILKDEGLTVSNGSATSDTGNVLRVVEAKNNSVTVWAQMMPMSGHENTERCGVHREVYNDPGQYILTVRWKNMFSTNYSILKLAKSVENRFKKMGFVVGNKPLECSLMARSVR